MSPRQEQNASDSERGVVQNVPGTESFAIIFMAEGGSLFGTRHAEPGLRQRPVAVSFDHFVDVAGDSADQVDVGLPEKVVKRVAQGTTNNKTDPEFLDLGRTFENGISLERYCFLGSCEPRAGFHKPELSAGIKNRGNPSPEDRHSRQVIL